jgi:hypothetical protein
MSWLSEGSRLALGAVDDGLAGCAARARWRAAVGAWRDGRGVRPPVLPSARGSPPTRGAAAGTRWRIAAGIGRGGGGAWSPPAQRSGRPCRLAEDGKRREDEYDEHGIHSE